MSLRRMKEDESEEEDCAIEDERVLVFVFFAGLEGGSAKEGSAARNKKGLAIAGQPRCLTHPPCQRPPQFQRPPPQ